MADDPVHYRWSSYRANGLGQPDSLLTPHPIYSALGNTVPVRLSAYRALFRPELDGDAIDDIRMTLNQGQPLGNSRFANQIEKITSAEWGHPLATCVNRR
jgi:putative transposase